MKMKRFSYKEFKRSIIEDLKNDKRNSIDSFNDLDNTIYTLHAYGFITHLQAQRLYFIVFQKRRSLIHWDDVKDEFYEGLNILQ